MTVTNTTMLATAMWLVGATLAQAQQPITKVNMLTIDATIQAIDSTERTITLRDDKGDEDTFSAASIQRFDELKVGQKVKITYYESLVLQALKPGDKPGGSSFDAAFNRAKSALPAGTLATQEKATVTVKAIDPAVPSVTVVSEEGRVVTRKIEDRSILSGIKPGDRIDITFTRALVTSVQAAN